MPRDEEYQIYTNSPLSHWMFGLLSNHATGRDLRLASKNVVIGEKSFMRSDETHYHYENGEYISKLIIQEINKKISASSQLSLIYVLIVGNYQNWKNNQATFMIDDYIRFKGEEITKNTRDSARRQLQQVMRRLLDCKIDVKYNRQTKRSFATNLLGSYSYNNGLCTVEFPRGVIEALNIYPQLFPSWGGKLTNQKSFAMTIYIYYRIKQTTPYECKLNINIKDLLSYAGIPYEKDQVANRRHKQLIINPFLKAIDDIHLISQGTLKINVPTFGGTDEFLKGYVTVEYDQKVADYYKSKQTKLKEKKNERTKGTTRQ